MINALSLLTALIAVSDATSEKQGSTSKLELIFDAFDFGVTGSMSMDELVILLYSLFKGLLLFHGSALSPKDTYLEYRLPTFHLPTFPCLRPLISSPGTS